MNDRRPTPCCDDCARRRATLAPEHASALDVVLADRWYVMVAAIAVGVGLAFLSQWVFQ